MDVIHRRVVWLVVMLGLALAPAAQEPQGTWQWGALAPGRAYTLEIRVVNACERAERVGISYWTEPASLGLALPESVLVPAGETRAITAEVRAPLEFAGDITGEVFLHYGGRAAPSCLPRTDGFVITGHVAPREGGATDRDRTIVALRSEIARLRATAAAPGAETGSYYADAAAGLRRGRARANEAADQAAEGRPGDAADTAREALDLLTEAERDLARGERDGSIGPATGDALRRFIGEAKAEAQGVLEAGAPAGAMVSVGPIFKWFDVPIPLEDPDRDDPRDEPPPVIYGEEVDGGAWVTSAAFAPTQGVWQDDDYFKDFPGKQLTRLSPTRWKAELPMVSGRRTLIYGTKAEFRDAITFRGLSTATVYVPLKLRITLRQATGEKVVYEETRATYQLPIEGPSRPPVEWMAVVDSSTGLPLPGTFPSFTFLNAGPYQLVAELVRGDGSPTGLKATVDGTVVDVPPLRVQFVPVAFRQMPASAWAPLEEAVARLAVTAPSWISRAFPVPQNGVTGTVAPAVVIPAPPGADPFQKLADVLVGVSPADRARHLRLAALEERLGTQALVSGVDRVAALLDRASFIDLRGADVPPQGWAVNERVVLIRYAGDASTVAHELAHTFPYLWSEPAMKTQFQFSYHNLEDPHVGNGVEIGIHVRDRHRGLPAIMGVDFGSWIAQGTYWNLLHAMRSDSGATAGAGGASSPASAGGERLAVRGMAARRGTRTAGVLLPGYAAATTGSAAPAADDPGWQAGWEIVQRDAGGDVLNRQPLPINWRPPHSTEDRVVVGFSTVVARDVAARRMDLVAPGGTVLDSLAISPSPPSVRILTPAGGAFVVGAGGLRVEWQGSDPDGDALTYTVLYSPDDGASWQMVAFDRRETGTAIPIQGRPVAVRIRVIATDGMRTATAELRGVY